MADIRVFLDVARHIALGHHGLELGGCPARDHAVYRMVAEAAGVSIGLVQHYFKSKAALKDGALLEAGNRMTTLIAENATMLEYAGRSLVEGEAIGAVIFDGLLGMLPSATTSPNNNSPAKANCAATRRHRMTPTAPADEISGALPGPRSDRQRPS